MKNKENKPELSIAENVCKFIQLCKKAPDKVEEVQWSTFITNMIHAGSESEEEKIRELCNHQLDLDDLDDLIKSAKNSSEPRTCKFIQDNGYKGCPTGGCGVKRPADLEIANLFIIDHCYHKVKLVNKIPILFPISNFIILPAERLIINESGQEYVKGDLYTTQGWIYRNFTFDPESFDSKMKFKKSLKGKLNLQYKGSDDDLQDIKRILAGYKPKVKIATRVMGLHNLEDRWIFVCNSGTVDKRGNVKDKDSWIFNPDQARINCSLTEASSLNQAELLTIIDPLLNFNDPSIVFPLIGWCFACFFKPRLFFLRQQFPLFNGHGQPDSGKTRTFQTVVLPLFGVVTGIDDIGNQTQFTFMREISSTNCIPIIYDEYKPSRLSKEKQDTISEIIRSVYNSLSGGRGQADQSQINYPYAAPVAILGEQGLVETAHKERIVGTFWTKEKRKKDRIYKDNFEKLKNLPLQKLGKDFLIWSLGCPDSLLKEVYEKELESIDPALESRVRENAAFARFGLRMLERYLKYKGIAMSFDDKVRAVDQAQIETIGTEKERKDIVDQTIEAFGLMADQEAQRIKVGEDIVVYYLLNKNEDYLIKPGKLGLNIGKIYPKFKKWVRDYGWEHDILEKDDFLKHLKNNTRYYQGYKVAKTEDNKSMGVHVFDLSKMDHLELGSKFQLSE